jgi:hypothetical protein
VCTPATTIKIAKNISRSAPNVYSFVSHLYGVFARFSFKATPDKKTFIPAVCNDFPKDAIKCIQSLPNGKIDITLRNEGLARAVIADRIRLNGPKGRPQPVGFWTTFLYVHQYLPSVLST